MYAAYYNYISLYSCKPHYALINRVYFGGAKQNMEKVGGGGGGGGGD